MLFIKRILYLNPKKPGGRNMLPKQDIMLKLAEIEESLNQLEQSIYDRISMEERAEESRLAGKIEDLECKVAAAESRAETFHNRREHSFAARKLELSYKTS
ncbi:hypothetical protein BHE18_09575 [Rossellomorea aquimaris]|uniref:Uncharacterized protein n=2 Tax=Rossellomorea aquimaris TaxID=189382 RepID=A0A1J6W118_9BACI|nr:hypothetical protein BHE18_09575 [Rossellomorea aquimaris]